MPKTQIPLQSVIPQQSILFTSMVVDTVNGMMFLNDGSSLLYVNNPAAVGGVLCTVTVQSVPDEAGRTGNVAYDAGYRIDVNPGEVRLFGPFRQAWWNQTAIDVGFVYLTFAQAGVANALVAVINN